MLGTIRSDAYGVMSGRASGSSQAVSETAPVRAQTKREARAEADAEQLRVFLSNITRADASAVIALTQPTRGEATASHATVMSAYGDF